MARYRNRSGDVLDTLVTGRWVRCRPGDVMTTPDDQLLSPALWERLDPSTRKAARPAPARTTPKEG